MRSTGFSIFKEWSCCVDFNAEAIDPDQVDHALEAMLETGVTACLPTLDHGSHRRGHREILSARPSAGSKPPRIRDGPGYHLEGPFLNATEGYAGCR